LMVLWTAQIIISSIGMKTGFREYGVDICAWAYIDLKTASCPIASWACWYVKYISHRHWITISFFLQGCIYTGTSPLFRTYFESRGRGGFMLTWVRILQHRSGSHPWSPIPACSYLHSCVLASTSDDRALHRTSTLIIIYQKSQHLQFAEHFTYSSGTALCIISSYS
jgi:hypothetical protein